MNLKIRAILAPLILILATFYLLPLGIKDTGIGMWVLLIIAPVVCIIAAMLVALRLGFAWWFPLLVGALFVPTIWIFYNESAWVYIIAYTLVSFLGLGAGVLMRKMK
ncbi:MAG TPA: hypothetical protein PKD55_07295 [Bellilinea sp.]|nr:hypothetical protein [Bellilinea sp.]